MAGRNPRCSYNLSFWSAAALLALIVSVGLVTRLESRYRSIADAPFLRLQTYASADKLWPVSDRIRRSLKHDGDTVTASYRFVSFGNDPIEAEATIQEEVYRADQKSFGYRQNELDALFDRQRQQLEQAQRWAIANHVSQEQLDLLAAAINKNYDHSVR